MTAPVIEFWFDFSSSYAYFAALEIEALAERFGRRALWRPFMLGTAFELTGAKGLSRTPLKKDYANHDWRRIARLRGVTFAPPPFHPTIALPATRAFYAIERTAPQRAPAFAKAVFETYYRGELDSGDPKAVQAFAERLGFDGAMVAAGMADPEIKALAKARSEEAVGRGVFGSPWFFADGEPFWGWDRMPMLEDWLRRGGW
jgi:2-hydroxychromene-2-carboxylate isomerase